MYIYCCLVATVHMLPKPMALPDLVLKTSQGRDTLKQKSLKIRVSTKAERNVHSEEIINFLTFGIFCLHNCGSLY